VYDIVFISYYEPNAEQNFDDLYSRFNTVGVFGDRVKRVSNVKGIHNAHIEAAKLAKTSYFYVVDGDAKVVQDFKFAHTAEERDIVLEKVDELISDDIVRYGDRNNVFFSENKQQWFSEQEREVT
jgi:hypothetical protein